ncbi:uncharacterized protein N7446_013842 [Penicillium canescens]|uniref:Uncharacterized protein n=1 Tax=Penicillium canescens TaxID=5083 RepID=A0AAD6I0H2_PENCN|nr:uncharacterized protein N7446_013842 [Penicillium canescens]KAJ6023480.1 hypothetical protein N7460_013875 [Penicillium canescens]KAJ6025248.1 hypothetical protein N7444_012927 [Penicillium canescens]KAJ6042776.1 hypothetical protein N7446_013842 [Penicillium canescens]
MAEKLDWYELLVLGDRVSDKAALTLLNTISLRPTYLTMEDLFRKQVKIYGQSRILELLNLVGLEEYTALRDRWIKFRDGFVLVYSVKLRSPIAYILKLPPAHPVAQGDYIIGVTKLPRIII